MTSFVYLIGRPGSSVAKIGRTTNLPKRLAAIQSMSPARVEVLWQTEGASPLERALHHHFRGIRQSGEWFDFGNQDPVEATRAAVERIGSSPQKGNTPIRNVRVPDEIWKAALAKAQAEGTTLTAVITRFLERYNTMTADERREAAGLNEPADTPIRADIRSLNAATITRLAAKAEEAAPDGWASRVAAGVPAAERPYTLVAVALDEEYLSESQIPH